MVGMAKLVLGLIDCFDGGLAGGRVDLLIDRRLGCLVLGLIDWPTD